MIGQTKIIVHVINIRVYILYKVIDRIQIQNVYD